MSVRADKAAKTAKIEARNDRIYEVWTSKTTKPRLRQHFLSVSDDHALVDQALARFKLPRIPRARWLLAPSRAQAVKQLRKLETAIQRLKAIDFPKYVGGKGEDWQRAISMLEREVKSAKAKCDDGSVAFQKTGTSQDWPAYWATYYSGNVYHILTGRVPARSQKNQVTRRNGKVVDQDDGPFTAFLSGVFDILGIKASARSHTKTAARRWSQSRK